MLELNLPRMFNAAEYFVDRNVAEGRGDKAAILFEDQAVTYGQLMERVNRMANVLTELGVGMEDRVLLLVRDTPEMLYSFYGAIKAGAVAIPTNILMKAPDCSRCLTHFKISVSWQVNPVDRATIRKGRYRFVSFLDILYLLI